MERLALGLEGTQITGFAFDTTVLKPGSIIGSKSTCRPIEIGQRILGVPSAYKDICHVGIVSLVSRTEITLLESVSRNDSLDGVAEYVYTPDEMHDLCRPHDFGMRTIAFNNEELRPYLAEVVHRFVYNYRYKEAEAKYSMRHVYQAAALPKKDTDKGRRRTLASRKAKFLTKSTGEPRKATMCSELVAEMVKIAQVNKIVEESGIDEEVMKLDEKKLKLFEELGKVLDVTSKRVTPGSLCALLAEKHNFETVLL